MIHLLREHRTAYTGGPAAYVPPVQDEQVGCLDADPDLVASMEELEAVFVTHYVKDKIDNLAKVENAAKRASKRKLLLQNVNAVMRDGLLAALRGKTLLSHLENKPYVVSEIDALDVISTLHSESLIPLTCVQLIHDIFTAMAKRGGSGKSSHQDLCKSPDPAQESFFDLLNRMEEAKKHLMALRPTSAEQVVDIIMATQLQAYLKEGASSKAPKERQDSFRLIVDGVEQALDQPGQLGPLTCAQMKDFGAKLQTMLQSRGLPEVPSKTVPAAETAGIEARLRKLESAGGPLGKPPDKPTTDKQKFKSAVQRGGGRARGRGDSARAIGRGMRAESVPPTDQRCFICAKVGCRPSTCPKGDPAVQKEFADKKAQRERANMQKHARRVQDVIDVSEDEAVFSSDTEL